MTVYDFAPRHIWTGPLRERPPNERNITSVIHDNAEYYYRIKPGERREFVRWLRFIFRRDGFTTLVVGHFPSYEIEYKPSPVQLPVEIDIKPILPETLRPISEADLRVHILGAHGSYYLRTFEGETSGPFPDKRSAVNHLRGWVRHQLSSTFEKITEKKGVRKMPNLAIKQDHIEDVLEYFDKYDVTKPIGLANLSVTDLNRFIELFEKMVPPEVDMLKPIVKDKS